MTKQEVHEIFCSMDDKTKMELASNCYLSGITVEALEETIASITTGVEAVAAPILEGYRYLNGGGE